jgi:CBS domain-containing protein
VVSGAAAATATVVEDEVDEDDEDVAAQPPEFDITNPADLSVTVGNLRSAEVTPESIHPSATLEAALTVMQMKDYSQLVVLKGPREIEGIVSYRSIARASVHSQPRHVSDCIDRTVPVVELDHALLDVVTMFERHDTVIVRGKDKTACGIVTAAELRSMAGPFLVIGEIEEHLRWLIDGRLDLPSITATFPGQAEGSRPKTRASDLTMGEMQRILENPEH